MNAIEMKLFMVKTVAQCAEIKIYQKFSPNNQYVCELGAANEGHESQKSMSRQIGKTV